MFQRDSDWDVGLRIDGKRKKENIGIPIVNRMLFRILST